VKRVVRYVAKNKLAKIALEGKACASIAKHPDGMTVMTFLRILWLYKVDTGYAKDNESLLVVLWVISI
jgi:large subunit ribosomal protein L10